MIFGKVFFIFFLIVVALFVLWFFVLYAYELWNDSSLREVMLRKKKGGRNRK